VELADRGHGTEPAGAEHDSHGGQHLLVDAHAVLGGEGELVGARPHAEGVEDGVLGPPGVLLGLALVAYGIRVDGHGGSLPRFELTRSCRCRTCRRWDGPWPRGRARSGPAWSDRRPARPWARDASP